MNVHILALWIKRDKETSLVIKRLFTMLLRGDNLIFGKGDFVALYTLQFKFEDTKGLGSRSSISDPRSDSDATENKEVSAVERGIQIQGVKFPTGRDSRGGAQSTLRSQRMKMPLFSFRHFR